MNKKNIENKIKNAFEAVTPAKLDDVLGCCAEQMAENRENQSAVLIPPPKKFRIRWAQAGALALVAICVSSAFMLNGRRASEVVIGSTETGNTESMTVTDSSDSTVIGEGEDIPATDSSTLSSGEVNCPLPDPEYRYMERVLEDVYFYFEEAMGDNWGEQYYKSEKRYTYATIGEHEGKDVYYVTMCIGDRRIDCVVPLIFKDDITEASITPLVISSVSESSYIGENNAKNIVFADADVSEADVRSVNVVVDGYRADPLYRITFYSGNERYYYELGAVDGEIFRSSVFDYKRVRDYLNKFYNDPENDYLFLLDDYKKRILSAVSAKSQSFSAKYNEEDLIIEVRCTDVGCSYITEKTEIDNNTFLYVNERAREENTAIINAAYVYGVMNYCDIWDEKVLYVECMSAEDESFDVLIRTENNVYRFGIDCYRGIDEWFKGVGELTYFGKAPVGYENGMKMFNIDSALQIALDHAGVSEYTLEYGESAHKEKAYLYEFIFTSGEYTYKYKIDAISGEILHYFSGSGKGDVSDVIFTVGNHRGMSKNSVDILLNDVKDEFAAWFDGAKLEEIWYDYEKLKDINKKYYDEVYSSYNWIETVGIRFTTGADYNGNYGLEPNKEYNMYCIVYNNRLINWKALAFVFE